MPDTIRIPGANHRDNHARSHPFEGLAERTNFILMKNRLLLYVSMIFITVGYAQTGYESGTYAVVDGKIKMRPTGLKAAEHICSERGHVPGSPVMTTLMYCEPIIEATECHSIQKENWCNDAMYTCGICGGYVKEPATVIKYAWKSKDCRHGKDNL